MDNKYLAELEADLALLNAFMNQPWPTASWVSQFWAARYAVEAELIEAHEEGGLQ